MDAVNGNQLYQTNANVANVAGNVLNVTNTVNNITNGGGVKYFHVNSTLADSSATGVNSVAIGGAASASAANSVALGSNSVANRANAVSVGAAGSERQIINVANATNGTDAVNLQQLLAMGANVNSSGVVTNSFVAYDDTSKGKVTFGGTGAAKAVTLTNVAAGVASSDAVNLGQLKQMGVNVDTSGNVTNAFVAYDDSTQGKITLKGAGGTTITNVKDGAVASGSMDAVNGNQLYQTNANVANVVGNVLNVTNTVNNITNGGGVKYFHVNSTLADSSATGANSVAIGGAASASAANAVALGSNSVANRANAVSVGAAGSERQIINVANATSGTDAVNLQQLQAMGANVNSSGVVTNSFVAYDDTSKGKVTFGGTGAAKAVTLTNVAAGVASSDAVNLGQLKQMGVNVDTSGNVTNSFVAYDDSTQGKITLNGAGGTTITNVKDGAVASGSMDAVNGNQLYQTNANVANVAGNVLNVTNTVNNITNGGGIKYFHVNSTLADSSATGANSVAIGGAASASAANSVALGSNSVANRANAVSVGAAGSERQIINVANATSGTDAVNLQQLQAMGANVNSSGVVTNSFVAYDDTSKGKVTFGGTGATNAVALTNIAAGQITSSSKDAVNGSQLFNMANSVATALGGGSSVSSNGAITAPSFQLSGGTYNSVGDALAGLDAEVGGINNNINDTTKYIKVVSTGGAAFASGKESIAIGGGAMATGNNSLAFGLGATSNNDNAVAIGANSVTNANNTVSVGSRGAERRITSVANGINPTDAATVAQLDALQTQLLQATPQSGGVKSMLLGATPVTSYISVSQNVVQGTATSASNDLNAMAIGPVAAVSGIGSLAVGAGALISMGGSTAIGTSAVVASANSTAIGTNASIGGLSDNSVAIGYLARGSAANTLALGAMASATSAGSVALGYGSFVNQSATNGMALGLNSSVSAANGVAIGYNAVADRANAVSVGSSKQQNQIINVAAGTSSNDAVNLGQMNTAIANASIGGSGAANAVVYDTSAHNLLTLGGSGATVPVALTNVAAGQIAAGSKDAVNGSQLYNVASTAAAALGGGATMGSDGKISTPSYKLNGQTYTDVGAALVAAAGSGGASPDAVVYDTSTHTTLTLNNGGAAVKVSNVANGVANNDAVNVQQLKAMGANVDSSGNVANAFVAYDDANKGTVTFGGVGSTTPVILANVGDGQIASNSKQAINGSQLYGAMSSTAAALGGGSTVSANGQISKPDVHRRRQLIRRC